MTKTRHLTDTFEDYKEAAQLLKEGEVIVFPTETVYGIGAAITSEDGLKKIFETKGRPQDNPLIVHISKSSQLEDLVEEVPEDAKKLIKNFWPGPLTIILKKKDSISSIVSAGLDTVGIRMPDNESALKLIDTLGTPIAAPSANISGKPSITRKEDLITEFDGKVSAIFLSEPSRIGIESTVLDLSGDEPAILRPGYISREDIEKVLEKDVKKGYKNSSGRPKSPGMKYKHYSPKAKVKLVTGNSLEVEEKIKLYQKEHPKDKIAIVRIGSSSKNDNNIIVMENIEDYMHQVYSVFRDFDKEGIDIILAQKPQENDNTAALIDRLERASGGEEF